MSEINYVKTNWVPKDKDGNVPANAPPISADNLNRIEIGISQCADAINRLFDFFDNESNRITKNLLTGVVIWENENPNEDFVAQTITPTNSGGYISLKNYKRFVFTIKDSTYTNNYYEHTVSGKNISYGLAAHGQHSGSFHPTRYVTINEETNKIDFGNVINPGGNIKNNYVIPIKIVAYTW